MGYFEKNLEGLQKNYSEIYDKLYGTGKDSYEWKPMVLQSEPSVSGELVLYVQKDNLVCRMNSAYVPSHEAGVWADQFELNNLNHIVTMFGFGNGVFVRGLMKKLKNDDRLFVYEPSPEIFDHVMHEYELTDILKNKKVLITVEGLNDFDFHNAMQCSLNLTNMYSIIRCMHPYYEDLFTESCVVYYKEIRDLMFHTQININTEVNFGPRLMTNSIANLKYIKDGYILQDIAPDLRTDLPAIIIAAGPSVQECIEDLKRAKGKAYIIAVDRILDYLLDEGVEPDFVVTVDHTKPLKYFSRREDITIPLLTELSANYEILDAHKGEKVFFNCSYFYRQMYGAAGKYMPLIITGASVATVAFSVCVHVGFQRIILVGQDLAYDGEVTHAGGVVEEVTDKIDFMIEGIDGKEVRTRHDWKEFVRWYKDVMHLFPEVTVIDTKKKGAKIHGSVLMPLGEAVDRYGAGEDQRIVELYSKEHKAFHGEDYKQALDFLEDSLEDLKKIKKKAKEAIDLCDKQIGAYTKDFGDNEYTHKIYDKISKINDFIENKPIYDLLDNILTSVNADDLSSIYQITEDDKKDKIETYEKSKKMYQATIEGVDFIHPKLKKALEDMKK